MVNDKNYIYNLLHKDFNKGFRKEKFRFRFPPEPNGYLHLGHAKSICLNFGLAKKYKYFTNLRFDDTNPTKKEDIFIKSIKTDIKWLGFSWDRECYASDYFDILYKWAFKLIQEGKAYIDEQSQKTILQQKTNSLEFGLESPYRNRPTEESLFHFKMMKDGKFEEGQKVLRAKINMKSKNINLRDPIMYRILKVTNQKDKNKWNIYPTYDWSHGQSDLLEKISHSFCSEEFENHRPLYKWYLNNIKKKEIPKQIEYTRLNISHMLLSKRNLKIIILDGFAEGWNDPRMPTLSGLRRKGCPAISILNFCHRIGFSKRENIINTSLLDFFIRKQLNKISYRIMVIIKPIKVILENYPNNQTEWFLSENNQEDQKAGKRKIPFSKTLFLEKEDFMEIKHKNFHRLSIDNNVQLKNAYTIKVTGFMKDYTGNLIEINASYNNNISYKKKINVILHWISTSYSFFIEVRLYDNFFTLGTPSVKKDLNHHSLMIIHCYSESFLKQKKLGELFQFQRIGYFCKDKNNDKKRTIFNRTVILKSILNK